jgi:histidine triad (HIT) family protein
MSIKTMQQCIFCEIVKKNIPAKVVYENDRIIAFLDINPLAVGHTLVVPKQHIPTIFEMNEAINQEIFKVAEKISLRMKEALQVDGVNLVNASGKAAEQSIPHFHLHVIPRREGDGISMNEWWLTKVKKMDERELNEIAKLIRIEPEEKIKEKEEVEEEKPIEHTEEEAFLIKRETELA